MSGDPENSAQRDAATGGGAGLADAVTDDAFLGGRVQLLQPRRGYRAATDPVFLAAACSAQAGDTVLDVGCGVGAASFCLATRAPDAMLLGVEAQADYARLADVNATRNGVRRWRSIVADIAAPCAEIRATTVDHVITNPPFFAAERSRALPEAGRDRAFREAASLDVWIDFCLRRLRPRGALTMIHRMERLPEILGALSGRAGAIVVAPLWPRRGAEAKRMILRAIKEARGPFRLTPGLTLHDADGGAFTPEAEAILRDGAALDLDGVAPRAATVESQAPESQA